MRLGVRRTGGAGEGRETDTVYVLSTGLLTQKDTGKDWDYPTSRRHESVTEPSLTGLLPTTGSTGARRDVSRYHDPMSPPPRKTSDTEVTTGRTPSLVHPTSRKGRGPVTTQSFLVGSDLIRHDKGLCGPSFRRVSSVSSVVRFDCVPRIWSVWETGSSSRTLCRTVVNGQGVGHRVVE